MESPGVRGRERAVKLLEDVDLGDRTQHRPSELSGGQRQRVSIARALANDPEIVLADELTGNLDTDTGARIMQLLTELNEEGKTIVMVTHDPKDAEYADRQEFVTVLGMPTDARELIKESWALELDEGRGIEPTDKSNIVIGSAVARNHFGEEIDLRSKLKVNSEDFRVVGTYKPTGDPSIDQAVVMPYPRPRTDPGVNHILLYSRSTFRSFTGKKSSENAAGGSTEI